MHKYITGLVSNRGAKMLAVHCMPDHAHIFIGFKPVISISDFAKEIKVESNEFINDKKWVNGKFAWQEGYGVFSYSHSHLSAVISYIHNQESHHQKTSFKQEYHDILKNSKYRMMKNIHSTSSNDLPATKITGPRSHSRIV